MNKIIYNGEVVGIVETPRYIKANSNGVYVQTDKANSTGIAVNGTAYIGAVAKEVDGGEYATETETLRAEVDFLNLLTGVETLEEEEETDDDAE